MIDWIELTEENLPKEEVLVTNWREEYGVGKIFFDGEYYGYRIILDDRYSIENISHYAILTPAKQK